MFDAFLREAATPSWWMGVVVVGFLINLGSAYAKPLLDKVVGKFWLSSKEAAERKEAFIAERAKILFESPLLVVELKLDILKHTLSAVLLIAFAIVCFLFIVLSQNESLMPILAYPFDPKNYLPIANMALIIFGGIQLTLASATFTKSIDGERILRAYQKLKNQADSGSA